MEKKSFVHKVWLLVLGHFIAMHPATLHCFSLFADETQLSNSTAAPLRLRPCFMGLLLPAVWKCFERNLFWDLKAIQTTVIVSQCGRSLKTSSRKHTFHRRVAGKCVDTQGNYFENLKKFASISWINFLEIYLRHFLHLPCILHNFQISFLYYFYLSFCFVV